MAEPTVAATLARTPTMPPTVRSLGWLHFLNDLTLDFLTPLLPAAVGLAWIGFMEGAADAVGQALKLVSGRASDRSGRRVGWVRAGYVVNALARPLCGLGMLAGSPIAVASCRIGDRIGKGVRGSAVDALVGDWTEGDGRAHAFARMRVMDNCGAVLGGLIAAGVSLVVPIDELGWAVLGSGAVAVLVVGLCARLRDARRGDEPVVVDAAWWPRDAALRRPLAVIALASLATRLSPLVVMMHVIGLDRHHDRAHVWRGCLVWSAFAALQAASSSLGGRLTVAMGPVGFLRIAWLANAAAFAALAIAAGPWRYVAGAAYAFVVASTDGAEKTWLAAVAPRAERARAFGALALLVALATAIASSGAGAALERIGPATFAAPAVVLLVALTLTRARATAAT